MKYIILIFISIFINSCSEESSSNKTKLIFNKEIIKKEPTKPKIETISLKNNNSEIKLEFKDDKLVYNKNKKVILAFLNNNNLSTEQLSYLKKLKTDFYIVKSEKLKTYFNIIDYPSIIILDKNSSKIYKNILPYEVLKIELQN